METFLNILIWLCVIAAIALAVFIAVRLIQRLRAMNRSRTSWENSFQQDEDDFEPPHRDNDETEVEDSPSWYDGYEFPSFANLNYVAIPASFTILINFTFCMSMTAWFFGLPDTNWLIKLVANVIDYPAWLLSGIVWIFIFVKGIDQVISGGGEFDEDVFNVRGVVLIALTRTPIALTEGLHAFNLWPFISVAPIDISPTTLDIEAVSIPCRANPNAQGEDGLVGGGSEIRVSRFSVIYHVEIPHWALGLGPGTIRTGIHNAILGRLRNLISSLTREQALAVHRENLEKQITDVVNEVSEDEQFGIRLQRVFLPELLPPQIVLDAAATVDVEQYQIDSQGRALQNLLGQMRIIQEAHPDMSLSDVRETALLVTEGITKDVVEIVRNASSVSEIESAAAINSRRGSRT